MSLLPTLREHQPDRRRRSSSPASPSSTARSTRIRGGAVDFLPKPFTAEHLLDRVARRLDAPGDRRARTRSGSTGCAIAVKRLNTIRRTISKKVDLLCNDLVTAYGELSKQLDGVRTQEGFRKVLDEAQGPRAAPLPRDGLAAAADRLLQRRGLARRRGQRVPARRLHEVHDPRRAAAHRRDEARAPAARHAREPRAARRRDASASKLTPAEASHLLNQAVLAANCTYLGESLAAIVFFRDARSPFTDEDVAALQAIARSSRWRWPASCATPSTGTRRESSPFYDDTEDKTDGPADGEDKGPKGNNKNKNKPQRDPRSDADWWKRGEPPPF